MKRLLAAGISLLALFASACGADSGGKSVEPNAIPPLPTAAEIAWFRQMAAFANAVSNLSGQAAVPGGAKAKAALRDCGPIFRNSVGPAPTSRQREAAQAILTACRDYRAGDLAAGDRTLNASAAHIFLRSDGRRLQSRGGVTEASRVEPRFSRVAAGLSGVPATVVRCWSLHDWVSLISERGAYTGGAVNLRADGFVSESTRVNLAPRMCDRLVRFVYEGKRPVRGKAKLRLANTILTLGHETVHVAPGGDEAVATCYGLQRIRGAARLLGAPVAYADSLAELAWTGLYPYGLARYHSPECRDGGKLDLNPRSSRWP